ncbi:5-(carboxyamino)imidazole ribonucleotide synthase [Ilumatobacter sp.]|uniref:5-(carboxyamino)imidazole ribonucleotide synthase n=1 Tax=Ilumatobacter sp. TaxID=1967498 RepID=UPI003AF52EB6
MSAVEPILPPATIGVLGGGQLGRYAVIAAGVMGYRTVVLEPDPVAPAGRVADVHLVAAYDDDEALRRMGDECSVVTTEFENPPAAALDVLDRRTLVAPSPMAVSIAQDRLLEKAFLTDAGMPVGPYAVVDDDAADPDIVYPAILKTARLGYDGKGQRLVSDASEMRAAWRLLGSVPCVLEQALDLRTEVSVVVARSASGAFASYPVAENTHVDGILDLTVVPASVPRRLADRAVGLGLAIADALDYVGVLAVEFFVVGSELLVNELAPRPHNSGHWTLDVAQTSQFEQQIRAVCGLPLGDTSLTRPGAAMVNLLGDLWDDGEPHWDAALQPGHTALHLYGKTTPRAGRKMGHLTSWGSRERAELTAVAARVALSRRG